MSSISADDSEAWIKSTPPRVSPAPRVSADARLTVHPHLPSSPRGNGNARALSRCLPSLAIGSLGLVLIGVALRGGAPPGAEAVRSWQDQAHNKTLCSPSSQAQARCAPAHPAHPAHTAQAHPSTQGLTAAAERMQQARIAAGRSSGKMNASRAEPPRPAAALPRASAAAAPLARPAAALARPAAAAAPSRPAVALPRPGAAALLRAPKFGSDTRKPPKPRGSVRTA